MLAFETLPELVRQAKSERLAALFEEHLAQTHEHVARLEEAFVAVGAEASSNRDAAADALAKQHAEQAQNAVGDRLADLLHAGAAIRTEHAELALYEGLLRLADALGAHDVSALLTANRNDEQRALELLEREAGRLAGELAGSGLEV
jgi:ferritin-like metal-binding protein YciE